MTAAAIRCAQLFLEIQVRTHAFSCQHFMYSAHALYSLIIIRERYKCNRRLFIKHLRKAVISNNCNILRYAYPVLFQSVYQSYCRNSRSTYNSLRHWYLSACKSIGKSGRIFVPEVAVKFPIIMQLDAMCGKCVTVTEQTVLGLVKAFETCDTVYFPVIMLCDEMLGQYAEFLSVLPERVFLAILIGCIYVDNRLAGITCDTYDLTANIVIFYYALVNDERIIILRVYKRENICCTPYRIFIRLSEVKVAVNKHIIAEHQSLCRYSLNSPSCCLGLKSYQNYTYSFSHNTAPFFPYYTAQYSLCQ